ncbi:Semaphorin-1A, variant 2 [Chamberlinius hualienensis]
MSFATMIFTRDILRKQPLSKMDVRRERRAIDLCRQWASVCIFLLVLNAGFELVLSSGWQDDVRPRTIVHLAENQVQRFAGNQSHVDHFKLLERDGDYLLIGARNMVYNISLQSLTEKLRLDWPANDIHFGLCQMKGRTEDDCQNYIRVLAKINDTHILVCGTNAYKPMCRYYFLEGETYKFNDSIPGQGLCPYDSKHNSTAVFTEGHLYVATVADFSGTDPLIYREPLRTEQYDPKHLNAPNFVSSMSFGEHVYFFFRETAVEYINCGKTVYSRVSRVCKNDRGGSHKFANRWTSFLKARLNCSVGGEFPFYFNEIQSTTGVVDGSYAGNKENIIYGVFTTPPNSISGSAVCAFRMKDIIATFEGAFKEQETMNSNWLPVPSSKVPEPRPGQCANDSRTLPDVPLNFIKSHTLMDQAVPAFWDHPLVIHTSLLFRFTQIAVDPQVRTVDGIAYDVLFIGTDNGKVIKAINADSQDSTKPSPVIIEEIQVFTSNMAITNLHVYRGISEDGEYEDSKLIVVSKEEIQAVRLARCYTDRILTCIECVKLQDPYCAWDEKRSKCTSDGSPQWNIHDYVQNIALGYHPRCSNGE